MKENASRLAELTSIACLEKKRKLQDEQLEIPYPKQLCRGPSWNSSKEPNKLGSDEFGKGGESDPESTNSNSFHSHSDSFMSIDDEAKTDPDCPETCASEEPSTSSASWAGTSSGTSLCRGPSWNSSKEPNKLGSDEFGKGGESDPESTNSNSFHSHSDSFMSIDDEAKTDPDCPETCASEEPSTSSASWAGTSSGTSLYTSENRPSVGTSTSEPESLSTDELHDCPEHQHGRHDMEFGSNVDLGFSEYGRAEITNYTEKELEDLLYSNGVGPGDSYILSSGRWSVNQDADAQQEGKKKLTIDKEFEQYFSMLML